jgi:hypothetical protein
MEVGGSGSAFGRGYVGEWVYVGWWGVVDADFVVVVLINGGRMRACGRWEWEGCVIHVLNGLM